MRMLVQAVIAILISFTFFYAAVLGSSRFSSDFGRVAPSRERLAPDIHPCAPRIEVARCRITAGARA